MSNNNKEQEMVNSIISNYSNLYIEKESSINVKGKSEFCDLTLRYHGVTYHLEVKHSNENNNYNYSKQMISECLYNRKKHDCNDEYGLLLDCDGYLSSELLNEIKKNYKVVDWVLFGKIFNCTIIFLYDESDAKLYNLKWEDLFEENMNSLINIISKSN